MSEKNDRRRKSVVDARLQWTLAVRIVLHLFLFLTASLFFGLILQYLSDPLSGIRQHMSRFGSQNAPMLITAGLLLPVFVIDLLRLSNRIAGPICRLRYTMGRLGAGQAVPPLSFRDNDMWGDLPRHFNQMVQRIRQSPPPQRAGSSGSAVAADFSDLSNASIETPGQ